MKRWFKRLMKSVGGGTKAVPTNGLYRNLGDAARSRGDWDAASRHYAFHLGENPQDFGIWVQLGHAFKERGLLDQADLAYAQAVRLDDKNVDLLIHRAHLAKGRRDYPAALEYFTRSYALDENADVAREMNGLEALAAANRSSRQQMASAGQDANRILRSLDIYNGVVPDLLALAK